jgi:hypothetical protein
MVADPQIPDWAMQVIQGSPAACAIVVVGYWFKGALDKHAAEAIRAVSMLAVAIQAATMSRPQTRPRNLPPKAEGGQGSRGTGPATLVPRD